ncbi:unnamed protein product [Miscanthus lutarioriparius]|uniref:Uncharacterized protein n=1 Tax=Miscanthus lutarioriparius TaxID=422564 RepID=A0A811R624_9POAL|nr:unnamed protein product [Miscanthus lutarioriparius]
MQAAAAFNRAAFTARPLHRPPRPLLHLAGAEDALAGRRGAPLTRPRCSGSLSVGVGSYGSGHTPVFPRQQSWDPYKLLGIDHDASEEEVRSARNFLLKQYAGYEESEEAIEGAYDTIIMNSYSHQIISRRFAFFAFFAGWSIATSAETGPTFQLALSLVSCIYFLNEKMKNLVRASTTGLGVFVGGWILGSFLVPVIQAFIIPPTWSLELLTSLTAYVFMFLGCTFLK